MTVEPGRCARHPKYWVEDCPACDNLAERAYGREPAEDAWQVGQDRYEGWLDRCSGG